MGGSGRLLLDASGCHQPVSYRGQIIECSGRLDSLRFPFSTDRIKYICRQEICAAEYYARLVTSGYTLMNHSASNRTSREQQAIALVWFWLIYSLQLALTDSVSAEGSAENTQHSYIAMLHIHAKAFPSPHGPTGRVKFL